MRRWIVLGARVVVLAVILLVWTRLGSRQTESLVISSPRKVLDWTWGWARGHRVHGLDDLIQTLREALYGYLIGVVLGVALAVLFAASETVQKLFAPVIAIFNSLPKVAIAPLLILVFGNTLEAKAYFVATGVMFIAFFNVYGGLRSIDVAHLTNVRILGANWWWQARELYMPSILGWLMTSLRLMAAWALTGAVIAEYLASSSGMGFVIASGQQVAAGDQVMGGIITIAVVALVVDRAIARVERRFLRWKVQ